MDTLGELIRRRRREAGLTQEQLAEKIQVSAGYIGKIELDLQSAGRKTLNKLSVALKIPPNDIYGAAGYRVPYWNVVSKVTGDYEKRFAALPMNLKVVLLDLAEVLEKYIK